MSNPTAVYVSANAGSPASVQVSQSASSPASVFITGTDPGAITCIIGNSGQATYTIGYVDAPATPTSSGTKGQQAWDGVYRYECVATDTWIRWVPQRTWS